MKGTRPPQVQCRECGTKHRATVCPICKEQTPHLAVLKGRSK
jgi:rubrerythrin